MKSKLNIVELFSGIGSQFRALKQLGFDINVIATSEWDIHAFIAYDFFNTKNAGKISKDVLKMSREDLLSKLKKYNLSADGKTKLSYQSLQRYNNDILKQIYSSILNTKNLVDISCVNGTDFISKKNERIDLMTYSFPCQDLSNVGAFHGYNKGIDKDSGSRSSLLWQVGRILKEMSDANLKMPRYLVMENVPSLLADRHINNFKQWIRDLEVLGYESCYVKVNAKNYGIPQNRPRLLMISVYMNDKTLKNREKISDYLNKLKENEDLVINDYKNSGYFKNKTLNSLLRRNNKIGTELYKEELDSTPNNTKSRKKIWDNNPKIVDKNNELTKEKFIRTVTTKQDRHPNSGNIYFDSGDKTKSKFRYLTPRECLLFMGFKDTDYDKLATCPLMTNKRSKFFPRDKIIRLAGNSIPVDMLEGFFYQIKQIENL